MPNGYNGKILRVNLSQSNITVDEPDDLFYRKYIGGASLVAHFLLTEVPPGVDALGPENKLIMAAGPVTGAAVPGNGRNCVGAKSPLTGGTAKSEVGGQWGAEFKHAGFDAVIVEGRAEKPVYLWIHDGEAIIEDARHLWGKDTKDAQDIIRVEKGDKSIRVAGIGPGGENMVRIACVINDLKEAAGRGGTGAVMGSKNLKAIAVRGHKRTRVADGERIKELRQWLVGHREMWAGFAEFGTGAAMGAGAASGNLPIRNFTDGEFGDADKISANVIKDTVRVGMEGCYACPVRCKKRIKFDEPYSVNPEYGGPEYETLASLGSNCGVNDLRAIIKGNERCNAYSLDTISAGDTIAFAMECFENGILTLEDTGGIDLRFGNAEAMIQCIELIARRDGIGDVLAEGTARAAQRIGRGAEQYAIHVKGVEVPMHEPRLKAVLGLGYSVNPHGADHCANLHDTMISQAGGMLDRMGPLGVAEPMLADDLSPSKVAVFRNVNLFRIAQDSLVLCQFVPWDVNQCAEILAVVTGWKTGAVDILKVAERAVTSFRLFNIRQGLTAADDKLPDRFFQPKRNGVLSSHNYNKAALDKARGYYYTLMGWDSETGVPTSEKLQELGIE